MDKQSIAIDFPLARVKFYWKISC